MSPDPICASVADLFSEFGVDGVLPKWAIISQDYRENLPAEALLSGRPALYLGNFSMPSILSFHNPADEAQVQADMAEQLRLHDALCVQPDEYPDDTEFDVVVPLLLGDTGDVIWGIECAWGDIEDATMPLTQKFGIAPIVEKTLGEVTNAFQNSHIYRALRKLIEHEFAARSSVDSFED